MMIDADGAPDAYQIDDPRNLSHEEDDNKQHLKYQTGLPVCPTSLIDARRAKADPERYVNPHNIPYIVYCLKSRNTDCCKLHHHDEVRVLAGDIAVVATVEANEEIKWYGAVVADHNSETRGEGSMALARLFGVDANPRNGGSKELKFIYIIFPGSRLAPAWPVSESEIQRIAKEKFEALGGTEFLRQRLKREPLPLAFLESDPESSEPIDRLALADDGSTEGEASSPA